MHARCWLFDAVQLFKGLLVTLLAIVELGQLVVKVVDELVLVGRGERQCQTQLPLGGGIVGCEEMPSGVNLGQLCTQSVVSWSVCQGGTHLVGHLFHDAVET